MSDTPLRLVIINGMPATGKTTIAAPLAQTLDLPLLAKDTVKEFLFDQLGTQDRAWSATLGRASSEFLYDLTGIMLADGRSMMIESAFHAEFARPRLQAIIESHSPEVTEIYCTVGREERRRRFVARNETGQRHAGHADHEGYPADSDPEPTGTYAPLQLGRLVRVDTARDVDIAQLAAQILATS